MAIAAFAITYTFLAVHSYIQKSATWDEPQHLTSGYLALEFGDFRVDPEHPPFLRLWAALPLYFRSGVHCDRAAIDAAEPREWLGYGEYQFAHRFLYKENDADRLLYPARFMIVLLSVTLGVLLFAWTRELLGFWPAVAALVLLCLEPNLMAHSSLVTTDFGVACFVFGTCYFLWRTSRRVSVANLAGLMAFFSLAIVSKFSAVISAPAAAALLLIRATRSEPWPWRNTILGSIRARVAAAVLILVLMLTSSYVALWASYGFRYAPSDSPTWTFRFDDDTTIRQRTPRLAQIVHWVDEHRLLPNACSQGFLYGQAKAQIRGAFLAGQVSGTGWWYYFPVVFAIKTPVAFMVLFTGGIAVSLRNWRKFKTDKVFVLLPVAFYFVVISTQNLNIGLRHMLPIYPMALLVAADGVAALLAVPPKFFLPALGALALTAAGEFARVYPHTLAFFNQFVGGPRNGSRYLVDSNLDWGQDLKLLKRWMDNHGVSTINLGYFGTADPAYYGISCIYLPGSPFFARQLIREPLLPGYVALSATILSGVYADKRERHFYRAFADRAPVDEIGYSIRIYQVDRPWWR